jgi:hypothetical protein
MSLETMFMFELLLVTVIIAVILGGVIYHLAARNRRTPARDGPPGRNHECSCWHGT